MSFRPIFIKQSRTLKKFYLAGFDLGSLFEVVPEAAAFVTSSDLIVAVPSLAIDPAPEVEVFTTCPILIAEEF
jgi:hypothetical protein